MMKKSREMDATTKRILSKEDYLKRYLPGYEEEKKRPKKKKKAAVIKPRTKIVDDDVDIRQLIPSPEERNDELFFDEVPQVAEIVDERSIEEIELENFRTGNKWRMIDDDEDQINVGGQNTRHDSGSDQSPSRRRQNTRHDSGSDQSPPRRRQNTRHDSGSDLSPPRRRQIARHDSGSDQSPPRRRQNTRHDSESDQSPPRRKNTRHDSGSDLSPPRKRQNAKHDSGSDQSPPRRKNTRHDSGTDQSPPRKRPDVRWLSSTDHSHTADNKRKFDRNPKLEKTSTGRAVGLQDAASMKKENEKRRKSDKAALKRVDDELSGRNASTVYRDKSGRKRDLNVEKLKHTEELKRKEEESKQFREWGRGVAQTQKHSEAVNDHVHEMEKPFARYENDTDLESMLKDQQRDGDPMLAFLKKKAAKVNAKGQVKEKPKYKGPAPPPNRFNIPPGYRWDGVNRSNGFEKKFFERISDKKAMTEVKYKWNVEDM
ncbi:BUD13 homolog isoform X2 [Anneissia japonica]|uniref:BUD13 homolog isoform X2 n=1 Tax=Anneissia japonica TaxID=1529436 RepID=UPI0014259BCD|nr:BUD13 homolog isoform X2 [Anneissia japonica]